jgi:hypothetical protein
VCAAIAYANVRECAATRPTCWLKLMKWNGEGRRDAMGTNSAAAILLPFIIMSIRSLPTTSPSVVAVLDNYRPKRTRRRAKQRQSIKTFPSLAVVIVSRRGFTLSTRSRSRSSTMVIEQKLPSPQSGLSLIKAQ